MNIEEKENEIGNCSEMIYLASKLENSRLRNWILANVNGYRQQLRMELENDKNKI